MEFVAIFWYQLSFINKQYGATGMAKKLLTTKS